jgi:hypothetical protein
VILSWCASEHLTAPTVLLRHTRRHADRAERRLCGVPAPLPCVTAGEIISMFIEIILDSTRMIRYSLKYGKI